MSSLRLFFIVIIFLESFPSLGQVTYEKNNYFILLNSGIQMSGMKSEDFIRKNYSPLYRSSLGKWISDCIGAQVGYQGRYFNTIENSDKRKYNFYFIEGVLDIKDALNFAPKDGGLFELFIHAGFGSFQNCYYVNWSTQGILGVSNSFTITEKVNFAISFDAIVGWDLYQGDKDILPNASIGLVYEF